MVEKIVLKNGVRLLHEHLPHLSSCALGIWVQSGSRHEPENLSGISHFIEHMLFKGTENRNMTQLAKEFDAIGGQVNAFTTKEHTCYYCRTLDEYLPRATELLCDMYFHSVFPEKETELERSVILEEIGMYEDTPEDLVNEQLFYGVYAGQSLGRPILGTKETLKNIDHKTLLDYQKQNYRSGNTVVALSGKYSDESLRELIRRFEEMQPGPLPQKGDASYRPSWIGKKKDTEQNHLIAAFPGIPLGSEERFTMQMLSNILGGGMSSRMFQRVREQSGLCYSIYSFSSSYFGTGILGIYTALSKATEQKALALIRQELDDFLQAGPTEEEFIRSREQSKANILMGMETTTSRMSNMARNELVLNRDVPPEEMVERIHMVTPDGLLDLARRLIDIKNMSFAAVGQISEQGIYRKALGL